MDTQNANSMQDSGAPPKLVASHSASLSNASAASAAPSEPAPAPVSAPNPLSGYSSELYSGYDYASKAADYAAFAMDEEEEDGEDDDLDLDELIMDLDHLNRDSSGGKAERGQTGGHAVQSVDRDGQDHMLETSLASSEAVLPQPSSSATASTITSGHHALLPPPPPPPPSSSSSSPSPPYAHSSSHRDQGSNSDFEPDELPPHKSQQPETRHNDIFVSSLTPAVASSPTLSATSTAEPVPPTHSFHRTQPSVSHSIKSSTGHSTNTSISRPVKQPAGHSINNSISHSSQHSLSLLQSPIRRKPLSAAASVLATRFSIPASRKSVANSIDTLVLDSADSQSLDHFPLPPQNLSSKTVAEQPEEGAVTSAVTALPSHIRNTSVSSSSSDFETNAQQDFHDPDSTATVTSSSHSQSHLVTLPSTVYSDPDSLSSSNVSPESVQDSVHVDDSRQLNSSLLSENNSDLHVSEVSRVDQDASRGDLQDVYSDNRPTELTNRDSHYESTDTETPYNKNRFSFQSSVYSLPITDNDAFDDSYPDFSLQTPLSKPPTRPTSDESPLTNYSPSALPSEKPQKLVLEAPHPPLPLNTTPEPVSAPTATIPPHAEAGLSSPISSTRQSLASLNKPLPRSPNDNSYSAQSQAQAQALGWTPGTASPQNGSSYSPLPSLGSPQRTYSIDQSLNGAYSTPKTTIPPHVLANKSALGYLEEQQTPQTKELTLVTSSFSNTTTTTPLEIDQMEDELKAISVELAASIRREMDLEDLVERLQNDAANPLQNNKRTSDYFSDSGYGSSKYGDYDQSREEIEKIQRKADQEKAQIRLDLTTKLQEEREKRRDLDTQIQELSAKAVRASETAQASAADSSRLKDLEKQCDDLRRRLTEEREIKSNFEDLLSALKDELQNAASERDNLRDEVVPQLRARVEGLESQNAEMATQSYEASKIQQELKALRDENDALRNSKFETEMKTKVTSLARSNSVASFKLQKAPGGLGRSNTVRAPTNPNIGGLSRSNTVKAVEKPSSLDSKDVLLERLKDVEAQRDALHSALKSLLERQELQNRESTKRIQTLETERTRLLEGSPRTAGYEREIDNLRLEITVLRRRAEEAVDQKWRVENGLRGLKMDLDRAEAEIASLRSLLEANDIMTPPAFSPGSGASNSAGAPVSSESLEQALLDMQAAYNQSLERIKELEASTTNAETAASMERLMAALASVTADRDAAKVEAASLRLQAMNASANQADQLKSEQALAEQLEASARRVEDLAAQVSEQLAANAALRQRLADTVSRGEADRQANVSWVNQLQERLRIMEDQLNAAQAATDERVARYEEEIAALKEAHSAQLQRFGSPLSSGGMLSPALRSPGLRSPYRKFAFDRRSEHLSPMPSPMFPKSPRSPRMVPSKTFEDEAERLQLKARVQELEKALTEAEIEMQNIVGKISESQIQVLMLQEERDSAMRDTKKVQRELEAEMARAKSLEAAAAAATA
ncbi:hypothetical protein TD95_004340 [Thielaviopsis punctulata]|uniref:DUF7603 domain-containing protein n=1 Tax=Thielaviopsis punctulata TaxID=72032 RepID=A0A0F4ZIF4_9PEZI|nr:hypothetical protein TD95_004340 [Thielaviopsis punctulata]